MHFIINYLPYQSSDSRIFVINTLSTTFLITLLTPAFPLPVYFPLLIVTADFKPPKWPVEIDYNQLATV